jgi:4-amino-4-deoxy-L-arabinose transferase-like glycosyltransferase
LVDGRDGAGERTPDRRDRSSVAGLVLLACALRVPTLAVQSLWLDEAYTLRLARMSFGGMLHAIPATESTPPLYYILAWLWTRVCGSSAFAIRSLSALLGILTVPVVYWLALRLAGRRAALIAGLLVALSPLLIWYSQEARAYALAALLGAASLLCLVAFLELDTGGGRWLAGWAASAALGLASHYFVAFVVVPELGWLLWRRGRDRRVLAAAGVVIAVAVALLPLALAQRGTGHADYISQGSLATRLLQIPKQFLTGYASPSQIVTSVLAALLAAAGAVAVLVRYRSRVGTRALIPLAVGLACVVIPIVLALAGVDFLDTRNVLPALPLLLVVVAIGFALIGGRAALGLTAGLGLVFVLVVALVDTHPRYQRDNWRGASRALGPARVTRAIVAENGSAGIPLQPYLPNLRSLRRATAVAELDFVALPSRVLGGGLGTPPRPAGPLPVPAGFRLTRATYADTYTVLRYTAAHPVPVAATALAAIRLGAGAPAVLIQRP